MKFESNIWKMYLIEFLRKSHIFAAVFIPFFTEFGKLNFTQILFIQSWFMFWIFVLEVPTGVIADRFGRKFTIIVSGFASAVAVLIYGSIPNFYFFLLAEFIWALSVSSISGSDQALIYDTLKKIKKTNLAKNIFARYQNAGLLAFVLIMPLSSIIAKFVSLQATMLLSAIPFTIAGFVSLTLKEPPYKNEKESMRVIKIFKDGLKIIRKNKALRILAIDAALAFTMFYFILYLYQPMLKKGGLDLVYWGIVGSAMNLLAILMLQKINAVEKFFGRKKIIYFSVLIPAVMYILSSFTSVLFLLIPAILLIFAFSQTRRPLLQNHMNWYIPSAQRATVVSMTSMIQQFIIILVNPFVGMLVDFSLDTALLSLGLAGLAIGFISKFHVQEKFLKK